MDEALRQAIETIEKLTIERAQLMAALSKATDLNERMLKGLDRASDLVNHFKTAENFWQGARLPKPGDVLVVKKSFMTMARVNYREGDELILIEPTQEAPWGFKSAICNWKVECRHFAPPQPQAVWSNIWMMIETRQVEFKVFE
jgi:hypothetical protein